MVRYCQLTAACYCLCVMVVSSQTCTWTVSTKGALKKFDGSLASLTSLASLAATSDADMMYVPTSDIIVEPPSIWFNETYSCQNCCKEMYTCLLCCTVMVMGVIPKKINCEKERFVPCDQTREVIRTYEDLGETWQHYGSQQEDAPGNMTQEIFFREASFFGAGMVHRIEFGYSVTTTTGTTASEHPRSAGKLRLSLLGVPISRDTTVSTPSQPINLWTSEWFDKQACSMLYSPHAVQPTGICRGRVVVVPPATTWMQDEERLIDIVTNIVMKVETMSLNSQWFVHFDNTGMIVKSTGLYPQGYPNTGASGIETCTCDIGTYKNMETHECLPCSSGKFSSSMRSDSGVLSNVCIPCQPGRYSSWLDSTMSSERHSCTKCDAGRYQSKKGTSSCIACAVGKHTLILGSASHNECILCPLGQYGNQDHVAGTSSQQCLACMAGKYKDDSNVAALETSCKMCEAGRFGIESGATSANQCYMCNKGKYSDVQGSSSEGECKNCEIGFFSSSLGATGCMWCIPGRFGHANGQHSCNQCPMGFFSMYKPNLKLVGGEVVSDDTEVDPLTSCFACPSGYFSEASSSTMCTQCPSGARSEPG